MKPSDYEFSVGDKVVTIYGVVGHVVDICRCDRCLERGFRELTWRSDADHDVGWITIYDAERGFDDFYQIGKYRFDHEFDREYVRSMISDKEAWIARFKGQLEVMDELEKEGKE